MSDANLDVSHTGGWVAMIQHYFVGAFVPDSKAQNYYYSKALANSRYVLGVMVPSKTIAPGESGTLGLKIYTGPKDQDRMEALAPYLQRTVDYGWLWFIAEPIFWSLRAIHGVLGNWGFAIILLTMIIKLLFFKLSAASYKSMANMRRLQPRIVQLRERYGSDKARVNQAMMELYKTEKINPLGGCLPIVVQIPVFISLYWVLLESVELRQQPFIFWLQDLSGHDPYFILPLLMGASMFVQQRLNPAPPDPMQAKIMMALPVVFTFMFLFFPSGLVLYWFVNNLLSIAQQWVITRKIVGPDDNLLGTDK
jgi:YidC/Oxa1 family membrane protein insertase